MQVLAICNLSLYHVNHESVYTVHYTWDFHLSLIHANTPEFLKKDPVEGASRCSARASLACSAQLLDTALVPVVARSNRASKNSLLSSRGAPDGVRRSLTAVSLSENAVFAISLSKLTSRVNLTRFLLLASFAIFLRDFFSFLYIFWLYATLGPPRAFFV